VKPRSDVLAGEIFAGAEHPPHILKEAQAVVDRALGAAGAAGAKGG